MEIRELELKNKIELLEEKITALNKKIISGENGFSKDMSGNDADNILNTGFYYGNGVKNTPYGYGCMLVIAHAWNKEYVLQLFFKLEANFDNIYVRTKYNGVWNKWKSTQLT